MKIQPPIEAFSERERESDDFVLEVFDNVVVPRGKLLGAAVEPVTGNEQPPEQLNDTEAIDLTTLE